MSEPKRKSPIITFFVSDKEFEEAEKAGKSFDFQKKLSEAKSKAE